MVPDCRGRTKPVAAGAVALHVPRYNVLNPLLMYQLRALNMETDQPGTPPPGHWDRWAEPQTLARLAGSLLPASTLKLPVGLERVVTMKCLCCCCLGCLKPACLMLHSSHKLSLAAVLTRQGNTRYRQCCCVQHSLCDCASIKCRHRCLCCCQCM